MYIGLLSPIVLASLAPTFSLYIYLEPTFDKFGKYNCLLSLWIYCFYRPQGIIAMIGLNVLNYLFIFYLFIQLFKKKILIQEFLYVTESGLGVCNLWNSKCINAVTYETDFLA